MDLVISLAIMVVCSIVIAKACDGFEVAADFLGRNMSEGIKGSTINAIGSSMPEFLTTVFFLYYADKSTLGYNLAASIGGDTGSAIFNSIIIPALFLLVLLFVGIKSTTINKKVLLKDGIFLIIAEIILLVLLSSSIITPVHGLILTIFYGIYLWYTLRSNKGNDLEEEDSWYNNLDSISDFGFYERFISKGKSMSSRAWIVLTIAVSIIAIACAGLVKGCEMMSEYLNINMLFVSLILVAAATSVPDTIISMKDAKKGNSTDALSNVLGSNIFDITISLGLPLFVYLLVTGQTIDFKEASKTLIDIRIILILVTLITIGIFYFSKKLTKNTVIALFLLYSVFIVYSIGAAQYNAGRDTFLASLSEQFIEFFESSLGEFLRNLSNSIL